MPDDRLARLMAAHRDELKGIYADSLWLVDNLRYLVAMLDGRGVALTDDEQAFLDAALTAIGGIQERIEARIPTRFLV